MKNKILICGSAIAVVVLVLASLSPVVGYNKAESSVKDSPLFSVRINRAIDRESKDLTYNYVGKGTTMPFPIRDSNAAMLQKLVDSISSMDDTEFNKFVDFVIKRINRDDKFKDVDTKVIRTTFYQLRDNPKLLRNYVSDEEEDDDLTFGNWVPFCFFRQLWLILYFVTGFIVMFISYYFPFIKYCSN